MLPPDITFLFLIGSTSRRGHRLQAAEYASLSTDLRTQYSAGECLVSAANTRLLYTRVYKCSALGPDSPFRPANASRYAQPLVIQTLGPKQRRKRLNAEDTILGITAKTPRQVSPTLGYHARKTQDGATTICAFETLLQEIKPKDSPKSHLMFSPEIPKSATSNASAGTILPCLLTAGCSPSRIPKPCTLKYEFACEISAEISFRSCYAAACKINNVSWLLVAVLLDALPGNATNLSQAWTGLSKILW